MRPSVFRATVDLAVPATRAWRFVADFANDPRWREGVASIAVTPAGVVRPDTTATEHLRVAGVMHVDHLAVTAIEPGRWFEWRSVVGEQRIAGRREIVPTGDASCRFELTLTYRPAVFELPVWPFVRRRLQAGRLRSVTRLAELLDGQAATGSSSSTASAGV